MSSSAVLAHRSVRRPLAAISSGGSSRRSRRSRSLPPRRARSSNGERRPPRRPAHGLLVLARGSDRLGSSAIRAGSLHSALGSSMIVGDPHVTNYSPVSPGAGSRGPGAPEPLTLRAGRSVWSLEPLLTPRTPAAGHKSRPRKQRTGGAALQSAAPPILTLSKAREPLSNGDTYRRPGGEDLARAL